MNWFWDYNQGAAGMRSPMDLRISTNWAQKNNCATKRFIGWPHQQGTRLLENTFNEQFQI